MAQHLAIINMPAMMAIVMMTSGRPTAASVTLLLSILASILDCCSDIFASDFNPKTFFDVSRSPRSRDRARHAAVVDAGGDGGARALTLKLLDIYTAEAPDAPPILDGRELARLGQPANGTAEQAGKVRHVMDAKEMFWESTRLAVLERMHAASLK